MSWTTLIAGFGLIAALAAAQQTEPQLLHVRTTFEFSVAAPQSTVAPLFGAHRERVWAEGWDPQFVYPQTPEDKQGAVFSVKHGHLNSTWITTIFEPEKGHIQHVAFIPDRIVTLIDIHLSRTGANGTHVQVAYERTALSPEMNGHVRQLGQNDASSGPQWEQEVASYLKKAAAGGAAH